MSCEVCLKTLLSFVVNSCLHSALSKALHPKKTPWTQATNVGMRLLGDG